jgi:hypothetical protein
MWCLSVFGLLWHRTNKHYASSHEKLVVQWWDALEYAWSTWHRTYQNWASCAIQGCTRACVVCLIACDLHALGVAFIFVICVPALVLTFNGCWARRRARCKRSWALTHASVCIWVCLCVYMCVCVCACLKYACVKKCMIHLYGLCVLLCGNGIEQGLLYGLVIKLLVLMCLGCVAAPGVSIWSAKKTVIEHTEFVISREREILEWAHQKNSGRALVGLQLWQRSRQTLWTTQVISLFTFYSQGVFHVLMCIIWIQ